MKFDRKNWDQLPKDAQYAVYTEAETKQEKAEAKATEEYKTRIQAYGNGLDRILTRLRNDLSEERQRNAVLKAQVKDLRSTVRALRKMHYPTVTEAQEAVKQWRESQMQERVDK